MKLEAPCPSPHSSQLPWSFRQYFEVKIVYRCDFLLISSYPSLLISSSFLIFESVSCITDQHIILYKYLYFNSWKIPVWGKRFLFLSWQKGVFRGGQAFFDPYFRVKINVYTGAIMLFFSSYLFLFFSSYLFLFFSYYILLLLTYSYLLILKLFVVLQTEKTPRQFQFGKKSAKVYHCLYSSIEQLQVALWTSMFISGLLIKNSLFTPSLFSLTISYLSISNPSLYKTSVRSPWSVWLLKHKE